MRFFDSKKQPTKEYYDEDTICNTSMEPDPGNLDGIWRQYTPIRVNANLQRQTIQVNVLSENLGKDQRSLARALADQKTFADKLEQASVKLQKLMSQPA